MQYLARIGDCPPGLQPCQGGMRRVRKGSGEGRGAAIGFETKNFPDQLQDSPVLGRLGGARALKRVAPARMVVSGSSVL